MNSLNFSQWTQHYLLFRDNYEGPRNLKSAMNGFTKAHVFSKNEWEKHEKNEQILESVKENKKDGQILETVKRNERENPKDNDSSA